MDKISGAARKPNLFIVGAPKCGTTTVARWLEGHAGAFMSKPKEPHYFSADLSNRLFTSKDEYLDLFSKARRDQRVICEASTWYLFSALAIPAIESFVAQPQYIVMTREPVELVHSLYLHNVRHLHENARSLEEAWRLESVRRQGRGIPAGCREPAFLLYREACALGLQVKRMLECVPPERILHIRLDDLREDAAGEYGRLLSFLGLDYDGREELSIENEFRNVRSEKVQGLLLRGGRWARRRLGVRRGLGLLRLNESKADKPPVSPSLAEEIRREFSEDQLALEEVVGLLRSEEA